MRRKIRTSDIAGYLLVLGLIVLVLYETGRIPLGALNIVPEGQILVKVVDKYDKPVQGAIVYIIPRDNGNIYDVLQRRVGYEAKCDSTDEGGLCDFGMYNASVSKQIGVVCPAAFNYSLNSLEYEPVIGSSVGYSVKITCPPNKRESINEMINESASVPQTPVVETPMKGVGPVCFMYAYADEYCTDFSYGDKYYFFNQNVQSPRGFTVKQCWTTPNFVWADCLPGEVGLGDKCVSQASYFTNMDCNSIKPGYARVGNFCVAPLPSNIITTTTTLPGATTTTIPNGLVTPIVTPSNIGSIVAVLFILIIVIVYKRGKL
jgi:hypothetical protein